LGKTYILRHSQELCIWRLSKESDIDIFAVLKPSNASKELLEKKRHSQRDIFPNPQKIHFETRLLIFQER
jgi:hypothetical protein